MAQLSPNFQPKSILIRIPNWLGDAVMATGVIAQAKALWPDASIDLIGPSGIVQLFEADPRIHQCWSWKAQGWRKYWPFHPTICALRKSHYELGILLTNSFSSAWQMLTMNISMRIGFAANSRSVLLTHSCPFPKDRDHQHLVITYQQILSQLVSNAKFLPIFSPKLYLEESTLQKAKHWIENNVAQHNPTAIVGLNPAAAYGPAKQWPANRFHELAKRMVKRGMTVLVFGDSSSKDLGSQITQGLDCTGRCYNLCGQTGMKDFIALMACCDVLITNDSGPMHLAAALSKPLVAIFGSTDDKVTGPYGCGHVIHKRVECSPCFKRVCPIDFRCMLRISVDEVEAAALDQLTKHKNHITF